MNSASIRRITFTYPEFESQGVEDGAFVMMAFQGELSGEAADQIHMQTNVFFVGERAFFERLAEPIFGIVANFLSEYTLFPGVFLVVKPASLQLQAALESVGL